MQHIVCFVYCIKVATGNKTFHSIYYGMCDVVFIVASWTQVQNIVLCSSYYGKSGE